MTTLKTEEQTSFQNYLEGLSDAKLAREYILASNKFAARWAKEPNCKAPFFWKTQMLGRENAKRIEAASAKVRAAQDLEKLTPEYKRRMQLIEQSNFRAHCILSAVSAVLRQNGEPSSDDLSLVIYTEAGWTRVRCTHAELMVEHLIEVELSKKHKEPCAVCEYLKPKL